ncbi:hypothetical protein D7D94_08915 [Microbacterium oryzae]|uniref:Integrase catalytic domain-containing protein n=2 Tax=Microbacterium oryzae TaxID=743009 RepID=A0A6I6E4U4_9MICO|nr:hypothetical protein D7D94_08915 [Microbacterium oryzae]
MDRRGLPPQTPPASPRKTDPSRVRDHNDGSRRPGGITPDSIKASADPIVGWRTMSKMPTDLPLDALEMALWVRDRAGQNITGVIQHSDAGSQYTALRYTDLLAEVGAIASIGTVGDSYDNALAESVVGLYKTECVKIDGPFRGADDLELATLSWVHWFNENRLHSSIGYLTPIEKENEYYREVNPQRQPALGELALH